ncbi:MAG: hypothetical protein ACK41T_08735 [Pseudobdellovibrio sp.]
MENLEIKKISVIGNIAGGKTRTSLELSKIYRLPVLHVDSIQFLPGMLIRPYSETIHIINETTDHQSEWIIDGYGPLDILEKRLGLSDKIVFIDLPLWRHYFWLIKRQIKNLWTPRKELPEGCHELSYKHTKKLLRTVWQIHTKMRPELLRILSRKQYSCKLVVIKNKAQLKRLQKYGTFS